MLFVFLSEIKTWDVKRCVGASLGLSGTIVQDIGLSAKLTVAHDECGTVGDGFRGEYGLQPCILIYLPLKKHL